MAPVMDQVQPDRDCRTHLTVSICSLMCCRSVVRSFRFAATLAASQLISTWIGITASITQARERAGQQLAAEEKKKGAGKVGFAWFAHTQTDRLQSWLVPDICQPCSTGGGGGRGGQVCTGGHNGTVSTVQILQTPPLWQGTSADVSNGLQAYLR
jgi:hypothetical protein